MTADRIYTALLRLYPAAFRDEYGAEMLSAFHDLRAARTSTPIRFWTFIVRDAVSSAARERLHGARWLATALFGLAVTVATARATTFAYRYFYHPYFEDTAVRPLPYGLLLGLVLGLSVAAAQWVLFPAEERRAGRWALASAVALPVAILFCSTAIEQALDGLSPVVPLHHPLALDILAVGFRYSGGWSAIATQFIAMALSALILVRIARPEGRAYTWDRGRHAD